MFGTWTPCPAGAVLAIAVALALPATVAPSVPAHAEAAQASMKVSAKPRITIRPKTSRVPPGLGFLPGYEPPLPNNIPYVPGYGYRSGWKGPRYPHYVDWYGRANYGWGRPGFYGGRWNGGSIGPCYTWTPIGAVWNCGK